METGKLCFSVSVGVAYGTGQIVTVKGERVEISVRKYYPYLDWLKAEQAVSAVKRKNRRGAGRAFPFLRYGRLPPLCGGDRGGVGGELGGKLIEQNKKSLKEYCLNTVII